MEKVLCPKRRFPALCGRRSQTAARAERIFSRLLLAQGLSAHDPAGGVAGGRRRASALEGGLSSRPQSAILLFFRLPVQPHRAGGVLHRFSACPPGGGEKARAFVFRVRGIYFARRDGHRRQSHGGLGAIFAQSRKSAVELPGVGRALPLYGRFGRAFGGVRISCGKRQGAGGPSRARRRGKACFSRVHFAGILRRYRPRLSSARFQL